MDVQRPNPPHSCHQELILRALVRVKGENHGINSKPSVEQLRDAIMLDWFDKQLKGRPEAWAARWSDAKR